MKFQKFMQVEHNLRKEKRANENLKKKQKKNKNKRKTNRCLSPTTASKI